MWVVMKFNENQVNGIEHFEGPCQVLAGPGSGKTLTIVNRIHNLIYKHRVKPEEILVITFTKAAALEMEQRFCQLEGVKSSLVNFGTFHGVFYGILRNTYRFNQSNIFAEREKYEILEEIVRDVDVPALNEEELLREVVADISVLKNNGLKLKAYSPKSMSKSAFKGVYHRYEERRKELKKIDFDDMLVLCYELLSSRAEVCEEWQKRFKFILVDEFQDINQVQYDVLKLLAYPENNVFVVGDDDQSIYGFRGASYKLMFQFQKDFPEHKQIVLNENYRSTKNIIELGLRLIENNQHRYPKDIVTRNGEGDEIYIKQNMKPSCESEYVIGEIQKRLNGGVKFGEIAVLYRTHEGVENLVERLFAHRIPFQTKDALKNIYNYFIAKDIQAYFRVAHGIGTRQDFLQIMNRPWRDLDRECLRAGTIFPEEKREPSSLYEGSGSGNVRRSNLYEMDFEKLREFYVDQEWMFEKIDAFEWDLKMLRTLTPYVGIQYIRKKIGYEEFLIECGIEYEECIQSWLGELSEIEENARVFPSVSKWLKHIEAYSRILEKKEEKEKEKEKDVKKDKRLNGVQLMTIHGSKGLEFNTVFIIGVNEGSIPYWRGVKDNVEEERRLLYVAITRAKEFLGITYTNEKNGIERRPSRFIRELS